MILKNNQVKIKIQIIKVKILYFFIFQSLKFLVSKVVQPSNDLGGAIKKKNILTKKKKIIRIHKLSKTRIRYKKN